MENVVKVLLLKSCIQFVEKWHKLNQDMPSAQAVDCLGEHLFIASGITGSWFVGDKKNTTSYRQANMVKRCVKGFFDTVD